MFIYSLNMKEENGDAYDRAIKDVKSRINDVIDHTLNDFGHEILILRNQPTWLSHFFNLSRLDVHLKSVTRGKVTKPEQIDKVARESLPTYIMAKRIIPYVLYDLENEYEGFTTDIICGNYESIFRTLRWMLETTVRAIEFQVDKSNAPVYANTIIENPSVVNELWEREHIVTTREFQERMYYMEKYKPPKFGIVLEKIPILKNHEHWEKLDPSIDRSDLRKKIISLYSELSQYSHYTRQTSEYSLRRKVFLDEPYTGRYDKRLFRQSYTISIQVLDAIFLSFALMDSWFYGYEAFHKYVKAMENEFRLLLKFIEDNDRISEVYPFLPITKQVVTRALDMQ